MKTMKKALPLLMMTLLAALCLMGAAQAEGDRFAFDRTVTTLFEGDELATVLERAGNAAEGEVTYTSSAKRNATVDENGVVTGLNKGMTTITANLQVGGRSFRAAITLTILRRVEHVGLDGEKAAIHQPDDPEIAPLLHTSTEHPVLVLPLGRTLTAPVVSEPVSADDRRLILTASDEGVLKVQGYNLTPVAAGECDLTLQSRQNPEVTAVYHVLVVTPVRAVAVEAEGEKTLYVGESTRLTALCQPEDATITAVTWRSRNEKAALVDENGVVTAVGKGSATITATATDGSGRSGNITLRVLQQPTDVTLNQTELTVNMGSAATLRATVGPANADDRRVSWQSSNEDVATVNAYGRVTPTGVGECTIVCVSADPAVTAECRVTVQQPVTKVSFTAKQVTCNVEGDCLLFWEIAPVTATNKAVTFKSSNEKVATVDANGVVHGVKRGSCTITATAADGSGRRGSVKVNVLQPVLGVHMYSDTLLVGVRESATARAVLEPDNASNKAMTWRSADESIAKVRGGSNKPTITGVKWGETTITGVTEDGGYTTTATVKVGNYDKALRINDLYLSDNRIKITVLNESNMNITRFSFLMECYDVYGEPLAVSATGSNCFDGSYSLALAPGESTQHGRFGFGEYVQPEELIGRVVMRITGYSTDEGYSRAIRDGRQPTAEYVSPAWVGAK